MNQLCGSGLCAVIGEVLVVAPAANDWARRNRVGSNLPVFAIIGFTAFSAVLESMLLGGILELSFLYVVNLRDKACQGGTETPYLHLRLRAMPGEPGVLVGSTMPDEYSHGVCGNGGHTSGRSNLLPWKVALRFSRLLYCSGRLPPLHSRADRGCSEICFTAPFPLLYRVYIPGRISPSVLEFFGNTRHLL